MGSYAFFRLGDYEFGQLKNVVDDEVLSVFDDSMLRRTKMRASDYYEWWEAEHGHDNPDADHDVEVIQLRAPGRVIAARLDLLGISEHEVRALLEREFADTAELHTEGLQLDDPERDERSRVIAEIAGSLTVDGWMDAVRDRDAVQRETRPHQPGSAGWMFELIEHWEWRHTHRLLLLVWPDDEVLLDLTDLNEGGWLDTTYEPFRPSVAMETLRQSLSTHAPIVVLPEGRTDSEFLAAALALLHPHLQDLIKFLDYESRPEGGAGALVKTVKAFASAGISNRVVALFDNDAAARDALRHLDVDKLPRNIAVLHYPDTELASRYPTLGPRVPTHRKAASALPM